MPIQREKMLKDHFIGMRKYMEACNDKLKTYDGVTKSICASVDTIEKYNLYGMKKNDIDRLKVACAQSFCNSVNSYPFCANLSGISQDADELLIKMLVKFFISDINIHESSKRIIINFQMYKTGYTTITFVPHIGYYLCMMITHGISLIFQAL
jgi:hypothetical protein